MLERLSRCAHPAAVLAHKRCLKCRMTVAGTFAARLAAIRHASALTAVEGLPAHGANMPPLFVLLVPMLEPLSKSHVTPP